MPSPPDRVAAVVPAYQAEQTIGEVLRGLRAALPDVSLLVVDDGSTDRSARVAAEAGARVIRHDRNRGKGAALRTGIGEALGGGAERVLTLDADGQHDPASAPALLASLATCDVVVGARARTGSRMPVHRRFTNYASSAAVSHLTGLRLRDVQSGYRAFTAAVARAVQPHGDGYEFETEFLVLAVRAGFRISSVDIPTLYGAASHFRLLRDGARVVRTIWRLR